jgi:hypothetical protein
VQNTEEENAVANEADTQQVTATSRGVFASHFCESLFYSFTVKAEEFKEEEFISAATPTTLKAAGAMANSGRFVCSSRDKSSDYHIHVDWRRRKGEFSLRVTFYDAHREPDEDEKEPFAEDFLRWVDDFFVTKGPRHAHTHAEFNYPSSIMGGRYFLLPLKTVLGPKKIEAEIDGLSFVLASRPGGIDKIWLTQRPKEWAVALTAETLVEFQTFDPALALTTLSRAVSEILEEAKQ